MKISRNPIPKQFERRVVRKFAIIPVTAVNSNTGDLETRWLENVAIEQVYAPLNDKWPFPRWKNSSFE